MQGTGLFIWQLDTIQDHCTPEQLADKLKTTPVKWVSWKLAEGIYRYNQVGGNDQMLIAYMQALEAVGIVSGGWSYNYPEKPGTQAGIIAERVAKFSNNLDHFDHWMLNIEGEWKKPNLGNAIDSLLYIDIARNFPVGFCSYRYPELHAPLNFPRFLKNPTIKFNAPQVYWIGAHDPAEQLDRSYAQYAKITDKPFIPIGACFGYGAWKPTAQDFYEFTSHCEERGWNTWGWWSLDWMLNHGLWPFTPPIPPPTPMPHYVKVKIDNANIRNAPIINAVSDIGDLGVGSVLEVTAEQGDWYQVKTFVAKSVVTTVS